MSALTLYDGTIRAIQALLDVPGRAALPVGGEAWPEVTDKSMILRGDMAYELGGEGLPAVGCTVVTADEALVPADALALIGDDLPRLHADTPFARVALVRVAADAMGEGQALYNAVRALEYTRYHFYPEGFMLRVSASRHKETVRVGRGALARGLDFSQAGGRMIAAFHQNEAVRAVQLCYVTQRAFDYKALERCAAQAEEITKALDHILKNAVMDCGACGLQKVCDAVEGLRALHFRP